MNYHRKELRQTVNYRYFDALPQSDIARVMGCSNRHVAELLARLEQWAEQPKVAACTT